jgi:hypothetical protein
VRGVVVTAGERQPLTAALAEQLEFVTTHTPEAVAYRLVTAEAALARLQDLIGRAAAGTQQPIDLNYIALLKDDWEDITDAALAGSSPAAEAETCPKCGGRSPGASSLCCAASGVSDTREGRSVVYADKDGEPGELLADAPAGEPLRLPASPVPAVADDPEVDVPANKDTDE